MKHDEKELVKFSFMIKNYYRDGAGEHEVKGFKTLKLFKSWFRLVKNKGRCLYGVVKFVDSGETWIWQDPGRVYHGGWQKALKCKNKPRQLTIEL